MPRSHDKWISVRNGRRRQFIESDSIESNRGQEHRTKPAYIDSISLISERKVSAPSVEKLQYIPADQVAWVQPGDCLLPDDCLPDWLTASRLSVSSGSVAAPTSCSQHDRGRCHDGGLRAFPRFSHHLFVYGFCHTVADAAGP